MSSQAAYSLHRQGYSRATRDTMARGDVWIQWFSCCVTQQPPPVRRRPPIDRSMIGLPLQHTFQHTAHIGSSDIAMGSRHLIALQQHMQSKGGYETAVPLEDPSSKKPSMAAT